MSPLFRLPGAARQDPSIAASLRLCAPELGAIAQHWFGVMRRCGRDVREILHDGHPTACVGDAAFAYVDVFRAHVNVGFFRGAELADPKGLLEGTGKLMRHVKVRPGKEPDAADLQALIVAAYVDMKVRVRRESARDGG
ncbi:MAG TPA: DUF1801 domain-containing protein [Lacunisphaera sp.]|nr:DUF1801 domain-containing protein [Lacunisphaera sp.]